MNKVRRYVRSWRVSRALTRDPQWRADVESSWAELQRKVEAGESLDTVDIDQLRAQFGPGPQGTEIDMAEGESACHRNLLSDPVEIDLDRHPDGTPYTDEDYPEAGAT